jgi:uncharacterized membrane protein
MIRKFLLSFIIFLLLDFTYIYSVSKLFNSQVLKVQKSPLTINKLGFLGSYVFLIFGLNYFILRTHRSVLYAFLFGITIYGVYETTNLALFKDWKLVTVLMDTLWGGVLFATTTYLTYKLT